VSGRPAGREWSGGGPLQGLPKSMVCGRLASLPLAVRDDGGLETHQCEGRAQVGKETTGTQKLNTCALYASGVVVQPATQWLLCCVNSELVVFFLVLLCACLFLPEPSRPMPRFVYRFFTPIRGAKSSPPPPSAPWQ